MSDPVVRDLSDLHKFNQCVDWEYGFRVFVRPSGNVTHPQHMGKLEAGLNHVFWKSQGYKYALRVWPKAYMTEKAVNVQR